MSWGRNIVYIVGIIAGFSILTFGTATSFLGILLCACVIVFFLYKIFDELEERENGR